MPDIFRECHERLPNGEPRQAPAAPADARGTEHDVKN